MNEIASVVHLMFKQLNSCIYIKEIISITHVNKWHNIFLCGDSGFSINLTLFSFWKLKGEKNT